jgi:antibiotic biosynthesis monooxygenase (ABM) superfamily enzyme
VKEASVIISLFGEVVVKPGKEADEARLTDKLSPILRSIPGFISSKNYRADDGEEIGIIRMASLEALDAWVNEGVHGSAQKIADQIYERFWVQSAQTFREYTWENGNRIDGDLTGLFIERQP